MNAKKLFVVLLLIAVFALSACSPSAAEIGEAVATAQAPQFQGLGEKIDNIPQAQPVDPAAVGQAVADAQKSQFEALQSEIAELQPTAVGPTPTPAPIDLPDLDNLRACLTTTANSVGGVNCADWRLDPTILAACGEMDAIQTEGEVYDCIALRAKQEQLTPVYAQLGFAEAPASAQQIAGAQTQTEGHQVGVTTDSSTEGGAVVSAEQETQTMGQWTLSYFTGATQLMKDFEFTNFVAGWSKFPNEDWSAGNFLAKNGLEYGQELSDFCQQDVTCDFPVAARSYRTITADYNIAGIGSCQEGGTGVGCALIIVNMGDVTASFRDQVVDTGHTITGLYWNGNEIDQAVSAWSNHVVYRMIGVPGNNPANPGANCSVPGGCKGVNVRFAIISGNELLVLGETTINPTQ